MSKECFKGVTEPTSTKGWITLESMIFCMNSNCLYYFEDSCMTGELENDNRVPLDLKHNGYDSCTKCPYYKEGVNEAYDEWSI